MAPKIYSQSRRKNLKDKAFIAAVSWDDLFQGIEELNVDPTHHIQICIDAMKNDCQRLRL